MTEQDGNVISLTGGALKSPQRDAFAAYVSTAFDDYAATHGHDPEAILVVFGGIHSKMQVGWDAPTYSSDGVTAYLSKVAMGLMGTIQEMMRGHD